MEPRQPFWKRWSGLVSAISWSGSAFWMLAKWIGLAGLPDDANKLQRWVHDMISTIPPPVLWAGLGASLMAALIFSVIYFTEKWADNKRSRPKAASGEATAASFAFGTRKPTGGAGPPPKLPWWKRPFRQPPSIFIEGRGRAEFPPGQATLTVVRKPKGERSWSDSDWGGLCCVLTIVGFFVVLIIIVT